MDDLRNPELKGIAITTTKDEVIAYIPTDSEKETIQKEGVLIRFNYGEEYKFEERNGKIYIVN